MSAPVVLPLAALEVRLTPLPRAAGATFAVWLATTGSDASERVATVRATTAEARGWRYLAEPAVIAALRAAIDAALDAHFAAATP